MEKVRHLFTLGYFYDRLEYLAVAILNTARSHRSWNRYMVKAAVEMELISGVFRDEICVYHMLKMHCNCNGPPANIKSAISYLAYEIMLLMDSPDFVRILWNRRPNIPAELMISIVKNAGITVS